MKSYRAKQDPEWAGMMMKVANGTYLPATRLKDVVGGLLIDLSTFVPPSRIYHEGEETEAIKAYLATGTLLGGWNLIQILPRGIEALYFDP